MIGIADLIYAKLVEGLVLIGVNPLACAEVEMLRIATALLLGAATVKLIADCAAQLHLHVISRAWSDPRVLSVWEACRATGGRRRRTAIRIAPPGMPPVFTTGAFRPTVHVSETLATRLSDEQLRAVLLHEIAHIDRKDHLVTAWMRPACLVVAAVLFQAFTLSWFFQPGSLHFGSVPAALLLAASTIVLLSLRVIVLRPLECLREYDADERAVAAGADPLVLASAIVDTARVIQRNGTRSVMRLLAHQSLVPRASVVERRVRRLLSDMPLRARAVSAGTRAGFVLALLLITIFVADFHARSAVSTKVPQGWSQIVHP